MFEELADALSAPIPDFARILVWAEFERLVRRLAGMGGLTTEGLQQLRADLRPGGEWQVSETESSCQPAHKVLLADIAWWLAASTDDPAGYLRWFEGIGDIPVLLPDGRMSDEPAQPHPDDPPIPLLPDYDES